MPVGTRAMDHGRALSSDTPGSWPTSTIGDQSAPWLAQIRDLGALESRGDQLLILADGDAWLNALREIGADPPASEGTDDRRCTHR